jgi:ssDNA-binding Zn-finger/Zn-ribbon topoisomerase 1
LGTLNLACDYKAVVLGKVRIADILKPQKGLNRSQWQTAFNKISSKNFDFVICNANDLSVLSVIELDDNSHNRKSSIKRDELVELACKNASLKLHRFKASATYNVNEIRNTIFETIVPPETESKEVTSTAPKCPKCTSELIIKTAKKAKNKGNQFLACSSFPKCRHTEEV